MTVTLRVRLVVPPGPVQLRVKLVSAVSGVLVAEPEAARLPDQPPDAWQPVALPAVQLRVTVCPDGTVVGAALNVRVGAGVAGALFNMTRRVAVSLPPGPVQVSVKSASALSGPMPVLPTTGRSPDHAPAAVQLVALLLVQRMTVDWLGSSVGSSALRLTTGRCCGSTTATSTLALPTPPRPRQ